MQNKVNVFSDKRKLLIFDIYFWELEDERNSRRQIEKETKEKNL